MRRCLTILAALTTAALSGGCASTLERMPIPTAMAAETAQIPNIPGSRFWADEAPRDIKATAREIDVPPLGSSAPLKSGRMQVDVLALSGGGPDGAFGAGLLAGWTERGDRPEFEHVTGVSAGSIIAPFAFLGSEYDSQLKEIWTSYNTEQLVVPQFITGLLGGDALTDTTPLKKLVAKYVDREFLKKIAAEHDRGRLLTVGTTNLDAKRPVVWNMGAIARHYENPEAVQLFRDVIIASAAIPGLFPPVNIKVRANGKVYDEMHVDGGVTRQIYVTPVNLPIKAFDVLYKKPPHRTLWLVHNGKMAPEYGAVPQSTFQIAGQSINALMLYQHKGDNYRIFRMAQDAGADFNSIAVPETFKAEYKEKFDLNYQKALYEEGMRLGREQTWRKVPIDVPDGTPGKTSPEVKRPATPQPSAPPAQPAAPAVAEPVAMR